MDMKETAKEQLQKAFRVLAEIKPLITKADKQKLYAEAGMNPTTLSLYLNGSSRVTNVDTAAMLITFFKNCIANREKFLAEA